MVPWHSGVLSVSARPRCSQAFSEKPKTKEALDAMKVDTTVLGESDGAAKPKP
jgi:hypothetical protein